MRLGVGKTGFGSAYGSRTNLKVSRLCAIPPQTCGMLRARGENANQPVCTIRAELRSSSVRICPNKQGGPFAHKLNPFS
jgi:hypothetical protein